LWGTDDDTTAAATTATATTAVITKEEKQKTAANPLPPFFEFVAVEIMNDFVIAIVLARWSTFGGYGCYLSPKRK
jgi:hypothetical protein